MHIPIPEADTQVALLTLGSGHLRLTHVGQCLLCQDWTDGGILPFGATGGRHHVSAFKRVQGLTIGAKPSGLGLWGFGAIT